MLKLRTYQPSDADIIVTWCRDPRVFYQWSGNHFATFPIAAEDFRFPEDHMSFTAFDEDGPVGFFTLNPQKGFPNNLRVGYVILDPARRGRGYGQEMLRLALDFAFDLYKADAATLGVFEHNVSAYNCYRAVGFEDSPIPRRPVRLMDEDWTYIDMTCNRR